MKAKKVRNNIKAIEEKTDKLFDADLSKEKRLKLMYELERKGYNYRFGTGNKETEKKWLGKKEI